MIICRNLSFSTLSNVVTKCVTNYYSSVNIETLCTKLCSWSSGTMKVSIFTFESKNLTVYR